MRIKTNAAIHGIIAIAVCMALFLPSCGTEDIDDLVNEYIGLQSRTVTGSAVLPLEGYTRYEAEDTYIFGGGIQTADAYLYSGGKYVNNLSNANKPDPNVFPTNWTGCNYVKFAVNVARDGVYNVDIVTNGDSGAKTIMIRVNDIENKAHTISGASSWNVMNVERFRLSLQTGLNFICVTGDVRETNDQWMNIDCIDVSNIPDPK